MKSVVFVFVLVLLTAMTPIRTTEEELAIPSFLLYPYVMFANSTSETLRFETNVNTSFTIEYGLTPSYGHSLDNNFFGVIHEINISGLLPNTLYYYKVTIKNLDGQASSYNSTFTTALNGGTPESFVFIVLGDSRADYGDGVDVNEFPILINHAVNNHNPRFIVMTGDVVTTTNNDYSQISQAWKTFTDLIANISDHIPIFNALGNHEHVTASTPNALLRYRQIWMHPHNGDGESPYFDEVTFWQEFGNSLLVFTSTEEPSYLPRIYGIQLSWLNNTLQKDGYMHKFVFFHRPICGTNRTGTISGSYPADSVILDRMFDSNNVTVAFAGHNHYYCYNTTTSGVTYVITGGAGAPLHDTTNALGTVKYGEYHYLVVNVTETTVNVTMVDIDGSANHSFLKLNTHTYIPGDVNHDGIVNILDAILLSNSFGFMPNNPEWNPNSDINNDEIVDILDAIILANHFGERSTYQITQSLRYWIAHVNHTSSLTVRGCVNMLPRSKHDRMIRGQNRMGDRSVHFR